MPDSFEEFLKTKSQDEHPADWDSRKKLWIGSIQQLYQNINKWVDPFVKKSLMKIHERNIEVYEQYLGSYEVPQLDIVIGNDIVSLIPKGTIILGSRGRIDIRGPKHDAMIVEPDWNDWKFVNKSNRLKRWDLNSETFKEIIQNVIDD